MKIKSIKRVSYTGKVYNIATPPCSNYFANGVLVHNCYQDSTVDGKHADDQMVQKIIYALTRMRVFEVAIGGGEPTLYPNFKDKIEHIRSFGIVPNFTTRNFDWLKIGDNLHWAFKHCGGIGISGARYDQVFNLCCRVVAEKLCTEKITFHYIIGKDCCLPDILNVLASFRARLLLLSFKQTGRAADIRPHNYDKDWIKCVTKCPSSLVGIDTPLAAEYKEQLEAAKISSRLYETKEGLRSLYIDAVRMVMGPSSYCDAKDLVPLDPEKDFEKQILDFWNKNKKDK